MTTSSDDLSRMAQAYQWSSRIMVLSMEMVLPGLAGYWVDRQIGTVCLFLMLGLTVGCTLGMRRLIRLAAKSSETGDHQPLADDLESK